MVEGVVCSPVSCDVWKTAPGTTPPCWCAWTGQTRCAARSSRFRPKVSYLTLLDAGDALELGATGMVLSFLLGYEETVEAACLKTTVQLALAGKDLGLPLLVEVCPSGPRVSLPGKAVESGASYALESGADVVVVPSPWVGFKPAGASASRFPSK